MPESALLSPEDIEKEGIFEEKRKVLYEKLHTVADIPTPSSVIKKMKGAGGNEYDYPDFSYMLELMNQYHPFRDEVIEFTMNSHAVVATARVTDKLTGETRTGVDAHRITFKKGEGKGLDAVVDLGNDYKSASTEALRHAYSRFGVCADIYKRIGQKPITKDQERKFYAVITEFTNVILKLPEDDTRKEAANKWVKEWIDSFKAQSQQTADDFINLFKDKFNQMKERINVQ